MAAALFSVHTFHLCRKVSALRRLRWNGWKMARELKLSRATVNRVLRRAGMNRLRSLDPPPFVVRYQHKQPGDLIHFDINRLARIVKPGRRVHGDRIRETRGTGYEFVHVAIDDLTPLAFAAILPDQKHRSAILFFHMSRAHYSRFGISVRRQLTDNGSCYATISSAHASPSFPQAPLHQGLSHPNQRQSRTLHPGRVARMGLCAHFPDLTGKAGRTRVRHRGC
jgi:hypothetical protein